MRFGVYYYIDKKTGETVYIGLDSNIDRYGGKRRRQHKTPSNYDGQPFNRILQNNLDRYSYHVYKTFETREEAAICEDKLIKLYLPKFNFKTGIDETPLSPPLYNVIKDGKDTNGKQRYSICGKRQKRLIRSVDKEALEEISYKLKNRLILESEVKPLYEPKYYVNKDGFTKQGKQTYSIRYKRKRIIQSSNKVFIDKLNNMLNNNEIDVGYVENTHARTLIKEVA